MPKRRIIPTALQHDVTQNSYNIKHQAVNAVYKNSQYSLQGSYETHEYLVWAKRTVP